MLQHLSHVATKGNIQLHLLKLAQLLQAYLGQQPLLLPCFGPLLPPPLGLIVIQTLLLLLFLQRITVFFRLSIIVHSSVGLVEVQQLTKVAKQAVGSLP
jgi:hypothetical protein